MYGFLISLGILFSILVCDHLVKKEKLDSNVLWESIPFVLIASVVGARIYHVLDYWKLYSQDPIYILAIWNGGLGILGGLILGLFGLLLYLKLKNQDIYKWLNIVAVSVPLAQAIGRMGNYFNQELYGNWIIPFFVMEAFLNLSFFFFLFVYYKKHRKHTLGIYFIGYGVIRFILEFTRDDSWIECGINITQVFCVLFILAGLIILASRNKMLK